VKKETLIRYNGKTSPQDAGWKYVHFRAASLAPGQQISGLTDDRETAVVILAGRCDVAITGGERWENVGGRSDVWEWTPPYTLLLPPGLRYDVTARTDLHVAVCGAETGRRTEPRLITPEQVKKETRGSGITERHIHHILPESAQAEALLLVEVLTPAGHWSSWPPHKHDTDDAPHETYLEETYYYRVRATDPAVEAKSPRRGFALQRIYTDDRRLNETLVVGDGDLVLVPKGYHPVAAAPGYDCYYLNVMAGPRRAWQFRVEPDHAWLMNWNPVR
jgi:5-deoxy-glucuronate isomerase